MVRIEVYTDTAGRIHGFAAKGHSGFAPHGQDIVCAAVSVLLQTAVLGLKEVADIIPQAEVADGYLECYLAPDQAEQPKVEAVLQTMLVGLKAIEEEYGDYVSVRVKST
ncbi:MAG: ribosomal-processing cysteine protease Prp [Firmicutes bacterium]|nr:ribosomal-processing cysteine protease Prp [Bacillota bacterium]